MKKIICAIFFLNLGNLCFSQETFNSSDVEKKSYQLYTEKKWDALILYGNKALENKIDYFYLRMRIGIAYYEKGEYRVAQKHFYKALEFNSTDDVVMEYLYYSYIFSVQFDEARKLTKKFSKELNKKLKIAEQSCINFIFAEGGSKQSSRSDLFSPPRYIQFGLGHQLGKSMSVTHAFTNYLQPLLGQPPAIQPGIFNQNQYYIKSNFALGKSWVLSPSVHFIFKKFTPNPPPQNMPKPARPPQTIINNSKIISLSLKKSLAYFDAKISSSFFKESRSKSILQESVSLIYFPFANNNVLIGINEYFISDNNVNKKFYAQSFTASARPFAKMQLTFNYLKNQSINLNEENGYVVNNTSDLTSSRISGTLDFSLGKNVSLYLLLMRENKIETQKKINYYYNSAIIGLKIIP